jgi:phosphate/sulfate permease
MAMGSSDRTTWFRVAACAHLTLVAAIAAGAYAGTLPTSLPQIPRADLAGHAVLMGVLAMLLDGAMRYRSVSVARVPVPLAAILVTSVAGVEEWAQRFSSRRTSCWSDFAADVVGVAVCCWLGRLLA